MMEFTDRQRENFWAKVNKNGPNGCWIFEGCVNYKGYGIFRVGAKTYVAHRVSFRMDGKEIPEGMFVCHTCDNRRCVNPAHLWLGTAQDNMDDMIAKGRDSHHIVFRGEDQGGSKLTNVEVLEIREKHATGEYILKKLAKEYNVCISTIGNIVNRVIWTHI